MSPGTGSELCGSCSYHASPHYGDCEDNPRARYVSSGAEHCGSGS